MYTWLVVWNIWIFFPKSWDDDPIWLAYFSEGLKPPTRQCLMYKIESWPAIFACDTRIASQNGIEPCTSGDSSKPSSFRVSCRQKWSGQSWGSCWGMSWCQCAIIASCRGMQALKSLCLRQWKFSPVKPLVAKNIINEKTAVCTRKPHLSMRVWAAARSMDLLWSSNGPWFAEEVFMCSHR